jgi:hypothetical protein
MPNGEVSIDLNGFVGILELRAKNHNVDDNHNLPNANVDTAATASLHSILGLDGISTPPTDDITAPSTPIERSQTETDIETYLLDLIRDYFTASGGIANVRNLGKHLKACRGYHKASKSALLELKENFDSLTKFLKIHEDIFSVQEEKGKGSPMPIFSMSQRSHTWPAQEIPIIITENTKEQFLKDTSSTSSLSSLPVFKVEDKKSPVRCQDSDSQVQRWENYNSHRRGSTEQLTLISFKSLYAERVKYG